MSTQLIKSSTEHVGPATIVLATASQSKVGTKERIKIMDMIKGAPLRILFITYANGDSEFRGEDDLKMKQLAQYGQFYKVPDTALLNHNVEQSEILNNIFLQISSETFGTPLNKVCFLFQTIFGR